MRSLLFVFGLFFLSFANASPVVLNFDNVELPKFIKSVYSGVLGVGYTVSPDVASSSISDFDKNVNTFKKLITSASAV